MTDTLDHLWQVCEQEQRLTPALIDYVRCEVGDEDQADFLTWAWRAERWPGADLGRKPADGKYYFLLWPKRGYVPDCCYDIPFTGRQPWRFVKRSTAREAFNDLFAEWKKRDIDSKRRLIAAGEDRR